MTGSEIQKIIEGMPDNMQVALIGGLDDAIEAICKFADYMRKNFVPVSVIDDIKTEIESNMESIVGKYDSSIPKAEMPSYKLERNKARKECIDIIVKHINGGCNK